MDPYLKLRSYSDKNDFHQVQLYYSHKGKVLILDTCVKCKEYHWTGKNVSSKCQDVNQDQDVLNDLLRKALTKVNGITLDYKMKNGINPSIDIVRDEYYKEAIRIEKDQDVIKLLTNWIEQKKKEVKSVRIYRTIELDLKELYPRKLLFNQIDMEFRNKIMDHWIKDGVQNSTINKRMLHLKTFLRDMTEQGYNEFSGYLKFKTSLTSTNSTSIVIPTYNQFRKLLTKRLKDKRLNYARDLYVISCVTGLRYSDCIRLNASNIVTDGGNKYIITNVQKTEDQQLRIPLNKIAERFLKKYGYNLKLLSNQKLNDALHDLFKELEFDAPTTVYEKRGANTTAVVKPLYKVLAFHSARRFFISYLVNSKKISIGNIMAWSNHKNINVVKKYIKQGMEQEEQMRELFG